MRQHLRAGRRLLNMLRGKDFFERPDISIKSEHLGSDYGGWQIASNTLSASSVVYSFGLGEDATFDVALIDRYGADVHCFDPTPKSLAWAARQGFSQKLKLYGKGLADYDGEASFYPPENRENVSHTILNTEKSSGSKIVVCVNRLETLMRELGHDHIDLPKMDIEGAEYSVIQDLEKSNITPKQLLVEFHHRFAGVGVSRSRDAITRLRKMGYHLFNVSPSGEEFSFLCE